MNKKTYITPETKVVAIENANTMLAGSGEPKLQIYDDEIDDDVDQL